MTPSALPLSRRISPFINHIAVNKRSSGCVRLAVAITLHANLLNTFIIDWVLLAKGLFLLSTFFFSDPLHLSRGIQKTLNGHSGGIEITPPFTPLFYPFRRLRYTASHWSRRF
jgi:hypothetical protein